MHLCEWGFFPVMEDKVEVRFRLTPLPPDCDWSMSESTIKSWQEFENPFECRYPVRSPMIDCIPSMTNKIRNRLTVISRSHQDTLVCVCVCVLVCCD